EDQGQPGRHQKQHDAELGAVQHLLEQVDHGRATTRPKTVIPAKAGIHLSAARAYPCAHDRKSSAGSAVTRGTVDPGLRRDEIGDGIRGWERAYFILHSAA